MFEDIFDEDGYGYEDDYLAEDMDAFGDDIFEDDWLDDPFRGSMTND